MRQVLVALLMLAPLMFVTPAAAVEGRSTSEVVCCPTPRSGYFILGSADSGKLNPFSERLGEDPESAVIANAVTSEEVVATWRCRCSRRYRSRKRGRSVCLCWWKTPVERK